MRQTDRTEKRRMRGRTTTKDNNKTDSKMEGERKRNRRRHRANGISFMADIAVAAANFF